MLRNSMKTLRNLFQKKVRVPAIGVLLFFKDSDASDEINSSGTPPHSSIANCSTEKAKEGFDELRHLFGSKPWKFHHRVAVTGKLMLCNSNTQDFYSYEISSTPQTRNPGRSTPMPSNARQKLGSSDSGGCCFPIWGVRKLHYGKQIMRFNLFVSCENWEDQIKLYRLLLRQNEEKVRDDFCYFSIFSKGATALQFSLKKLPKDIKPQPLRSTVLQFQVKNVGQLVPLLPHSCDPISDLRWRTRDHDSNLILLQIHRSTTRVSETDFIEKAFSDYDSPAGDNRSRTPDLLNRSRIKATRAPTPIARVRPICPPQSPAGEEGRYPQPKPRLLKGHFASTLDSRAAIKDKLSVPPRPSSRLAVRSSCSTTLPSSLRQEGTASPKSASDKMQRKGKTDFFAARKSPCFEKHSEGVFVWYTAVKCCRIQRIVFVFLQVN